jgi:hypothetical protein
MADEETRKRESGVPEFDAASAPDETGGLEQSEGGRGELVNESPEGRLLHRGTVVTSNPAPLAPDTERDRFEQLDDEATDEARNDVRRREHSPD